MKIPRITILEPYTPSPEQAVQCQAQDDRSLLKPARFWLGLIAVAASLFNMPTAQAGGKHQYIVHPIAPSKLIAKEIESLNALFRLYFTNRKAG
jgi:hypothetical protein